MPKSKYLEIRTDVKTQNQGERETRSGILTSLISQGPTILCQASEVPIHQELGTLDAVTILKLVNYSLSH